MKTIYKYPLEVADFQVVEMPGDAVILCVQVQGTGPCLWAEVDPARPSEGRRIRTYGTGHPIPPSASRTYLGTYQLDGGALVFHVFEEHALDGNPS